MLAPKSKFAKEELTARAWKREVAPESPIRFNLKFKLVTEELAERTLEREAASESSTFILLKSKSLT